MSSAPSKRTLPWDWFPGTIPDNVELDETAYLETSNSFVLYRSTLPTGMRIDRGAAVYLGTLFDVGSRGHVTVGQYALVNGAYVLCDSEVTIGDHVLISWNVVLMDSFRVPLDPTLRRTVLGRVPFQAIRHPRPDASDPPAQPVRICRNVWLGFDVCVLPGVTIGEGSIVGARSVVTEDVAPFTVVAGNPARSIQRLDPGVSPDAD